MPDTNHYTGLPVPLPGEASSGPDDFSLFRAALGGHTVLYATTSANRDSLYASVPTGTLCVSTSSKTIWQKTDAGWDTVYSDTGWVSLATAGWTSSDFVDNGSGYRIKNSMCYLDIRFTYNGSDLVPTSTGQVTNTKIITLPSVCNPAGRANIHIPETLEYGVNNGSAVLYQSTNGITITTLMPNNSLIAGTNCNWNTSYYVD